MKTTNQEMKLNNWSSKKSIHMDIYSVQEMFIRYNVYFSFNYFNFYFEIIFYFKNNWFKNKTRYL